MGQNVFSQSDCRGFFQTIPSKQITESAWAFACWYKFTLKVDQKFLGGHGQKCLTTFQEWKDGVNWLHAGASSGKVKVIPMIFGWVLSKNRYDHLVHETLKYAVS